MSGNARLIDTNVLVHAYTIAEDRKHRIALPLLERIWEGEEATTTLQNLCEFFFVTTRKVAKPISATAAEAVVKGIVAGSQWRIIDRSTETVFKAIEMVRLYRTSRRYGTRPDGNGAECGIWKDEGNLQAGKEKG